MPDGKLREIEPSDLVPGAVIREISVASYVRSLDAWTAISPPFADTVVIEDPRDDDEQWVTLERPFVMLCAGRIAFSSENIKVPMKSLCGPDSHYRLVCGARGQAFNIRR